jgi:hypothetical protein
MEGHVAGQVAVDCESYRSEVLNNGGLALHDGEVTIGIINFGKNCSASKVASVRGSLQRASQAKPQFGRRTLPEAEFTAGDIAGFKYIAIGPTGQTVGAAYLLQVKSGYVLVQIGTNEQFFDERKYEESLLPTLRIE